MAAAPSPGPFFRRESELVELPDPRFQKAVSEFNQGEYFEAHEIWEELWKETPFGELRRFYQGLIQVAAGYHKLHLPRGPHLRGARTLLSRGLEKLGRYPDYFFGVELDRLRRAVGEDLGKLQGVDPAGFSAELLRQPKISQ